MTARILWRRPESLRKIAKRARATSDPVERLRYVRHQMVSRELPERFRRWPMSWWPARRIGPAVAVAVAAALLVWWIR